MSQHKLLPLMLFVVASNTKTIVYKIKKHGFNQTLKARTQQEEKYCAHLVRIDTSKVYCASKV